MNVQKVLAVYTIVNINIRILSICDILLSVLLCIKHMNELKLQECAVFVLGSCQVLTSELKAKLDAVEKRAPILSKASLGT